MNNNEGHANGIKKSIENIIGGNTNIKNKRPSEESIQKNKFEKIILAMETIEVKTALLNSEFRIDLTEYNETFYTAIDNLLELCFEKQINDIISFYLYERINPDGSINPIQDSKGNEIILENPSDLWYLIKLLQQEKK